MKKIVTSYCTFCMLILICSCASYTTVSNKLPEVLSQTQQAVSNLAEKIPDLQNDSLTAAFNRLEEKRKELFPLLIKCNEKYRLSKDYIATLQGAQKSLQRLYEGFDTISDKKYILYAISEDYDAKITSIQNDPNNEATTTIRVIVDSNGDEGFFVFGKLSYEEELDIKRFRFNGPTQNAIQDFVPGYYLFWLEKDGLIGDPELHLIRSNGIELEKKLILKTPK